MLASIAPTPPNPYPPRTASKSEPSKAKDVARIGVVGPIVTLFVHPFDTFGHRHVKNANSAEKMPVFENPFAGARYLIGLRTLSRTLVFGVQSAVQPSVKQLLIPLVKDENQLNYASQISAGFIAGATEAILHPFNLLVTKVQVAKTKTRITKEMTTHFFTNGEPWKGVQYTALRDSLSAAMIFACLEYFKSFIPRDKQTDLKWVAASGLVAGGTAGAFTAYPAAVINQIASHNNTSINPEALWRALPCRAGSLGMVVTGMLTGKEIVNRLFNRLELSAT